MPPCVAFDSYTTNNQRICRASQSITEPATTLIRKAILHQPRSVDISQKWAPAVIVAVIITGCLIIALVWKLVRDYWRRVHHPISVAMPSHNEDTASICGTTNQSDKSRTQLSSGNNVQDRNGSKDTFATGSCDGDSSVIEVSIARPVIISPVTSPAGEVKVIEISGPSKKPVGDDKETPKAEEGGR